MNDRTTYANNFNLFGNPRGYQHTDNAMILDGVDDYMFLESLDELGNQHNLSVTITFSYKEIKNRLSAIMVRSASSSGHNGFVVVGPDGTELELWARNGATWTTLYKQDIGLNNFVTATVTIDENSLVKTYLNGVLVNTVTFSNTLFTALDRFVIGANGLFEINAHIAFGSFMVHNRTLSDLEVKQIYNYESKIKRVGVI